MAETPVTLRCELQVVTTAAEFAASCVPWHEFLRRPTVVAGFFTDPVVVEQQVDFARGDRLLLGWIRDQANIRAIVPLIGRSTRVPCRFGIVTVLRPAARVARLPDFEFPREATLAPHTAFALVVAALRRGNRLADLLVVDSAPHGAGPPDRLRDVQTTYTIALTGDFASYLAAFTHKSRQNITRAVRRMPGAAGAPVRVAAYRQPDQMPALRAQMDAIWQRSWHARVGRQPVPSESYLRALAEHGWVRAYVLFVGEQPVASALGYQYRDTYYYEAPAYDQQWQDRSPGIVLLYHVLQDLFAADRPARFDFGFSYGQYKQVFGTHEEQRGSIQLGLTARGRWLDGLQTALAATFQWGKAALAWTGLPRLIKKKIRGEK